MSNNNTQLPFIWYPPPSAPVTIPAQPAVPTVPNVPNNHPTPPYGTPVYNPHAVWVSPNYPTNWIGTSCTDDEEEEKIEEVKANKEPQIYECVKCGELYPYADPPEPEKFNCYSCRLVW